MTQRLTDQQIVTLVADALEQVAPGRSEELSGVGFDISIRELSLDSVATMEMIGCIEEKLGVTFPDEELASIAKLSDLAAMIRRHAE